MKITRIHASSLVRYEPTGYDTDPEYKLGVKHPTD